MPSTVSIMYRTVGYMLLTAMIHFFCYDSFLSLTLQGNKDKVFESIDEATN